MKIVLLFSLKKERPKPFSRVFQQFSPKEFVFKFRDEKIQTLVFILSFAPKNYRKRVVKLIKDESRRKMIIESLGSMEHIAPPSDFIAELEKAILE
jgi:flagellar motor switch protein FliG